MKFIRVAAMLIVAAMAYSACDKDDAAPETEFKFTYDGKQYSSHSTTAYITDTIIAGQKSIVIDGVTDNIHDHMQLLIISPDDSLLVGTYSGATISLMPVSDTTVQGSLGQNSIEVQISSINSTRAEGTFHGTLKQNGEVEKPLTDGTFKVNIIN